MKTRSWLAPVTLGLALIGSQSGWVAAQTASPVASESIGSLELIGEQRISNLTMVDGTLVGGLSGIDYNSETGQWIVISDDRSDNNPARFYDLSLTYTADAFESVEITAEHTFLQADGNPYPNREQGGDVPDPEAIRFDPETGNLWWTSEGDRELDLDPLLHEADATGKTINTYTLPEGFSMDPATEHGPRNNKVLEGLTVSADGQSLYGIMEGALYQDGPLSTADTGSVVRIIKFDRSGQVIAQYAYDIDPIQATPEGEGADNGATEILAVDDTRFLVIERSGVPNADGVFSLYNRLYEIDITGATDVNGIDALTPGSYTFPTKRLLIDFADAGFDYVDNLEGLSWGPTLPNGNPSLVIVSDNNFNETQKTQFYVYEVLP